MVKFYAVLKSTGRVPLTNAPDRKHAEFFAQGAFGKDLVEVVEE
ncbi:hypothetical protein [Ensifer sp. ENS04]|nr:hypothetical protein [Ensifer sp. ENS04]